MSKALEKDVPLEVNAGGIRRGYRKVGDEINIHIPIVTFLILLER